MKTILLIEDNDEIRENTAEILELAMYNVHTAENGKVGVEKAIDLDQNWGLKSQGVLGSQIVLIDIIDRAPPLAEVRITMIVNYNYLRN